MPLSIGADPWAPGLKPGRYTAGSDSELPILVWAAMPEGTTEGGLWRESRKSLLLAPACAAIWSGRCTSSFSVSPSFFFFSRLVLCSFTKRVKESCQWCASVSLPSTRVRPLVASGLAVMHSCYLRLLVAVVVLPFSSACRSCAFTRPHTTFFHCLVLSVLAS